MQSSGINPARCRAECAPQFDRLPSHARSPAGNLPLGNCWKKGMQTWGWTAVTQTSPAVSTRSIGGIWIFACARAIREITALALKSSEGSHAIPIASIRTCFPHFVRKRPVVRGNEKVSPESAVTVNKWHRYIRRNEVPIQADIWLYKNANKIRLFTSGIGVPRYAM